ncbi:uncharacterized protein LOC119349400 [Triticum dicoccoides]|uniref:uncharacterized protein LOC119349400 n=1 Tax=Triticum dicoccoides TaxID=85692 RepID=UPI00188E7115|nr:uncharacterized protein LOC119349400 [Triticum dicoccoides]
MQAGAASMDVELHPLLPRRPERRAATMDGRSCNPFSWELHRRPWELRPKFELQPWMAGSCNRPPGELRAVNGEGEAILRGSSVSLRCLRRKLLGSLSGRWTAAIFRWKRSSWHGSSISL